MCCQTDGCQLFLGEKATDATIIASKSSECNVTTPAVTEDGDEVEAALPEQVGQRFQYPCKVHTVFVSYFAVSKKW